MTHCHNCDTDYEDEALDIEDQIFENGVTHIRASCPACKKFIKYLKQWVSANPMSIIPFGKHKGKSVMSSTHEDKDYAVWFVNTQKGKYREAFILALQSL